MSSNNDKFLRWLIPTVASIFWMKSGFAQQTIDYPLVGVQLAVGWRTTLAEPADDVCVEFKRRFDAAQVVNTVVNDFRLTETLHREMDVSVEFSAKLIAGVGGSLKSKFMNEYNSSLDEQSYVVQSTVENEWETAGPAENGPLAIKEKYLVLLKEPDGLRLFQKACGDAFVYRRKGGAELTALTTLHATSRESKDKVGFAVEGGGITVNVKGAMDSEDDSKESYATTTFNYLLVGGAGAIGAFDKTSINQLISSLPALAKDNPKYLKIELRSYDSLSNWPDVATSDPHERNLKVAVVQHLKLSDIERLVTDAVVNEGNYIPTSLLRTHLRIIDAELRPKLNVLKLAISSCLNDPVACDKLPTQDDIDYYSYYAALPLKYGSTLYDKKIQKAEANAREANASATNAVNGIFQKYGFPVTCEFLVNPPPPPDQAGQANVPTAGEPPEYADARNQCKVKFAAETRLRDLAAGAGPALSESLFRIWIADISDVACKSDFSSKDCLSASELDAWRRRFELLPRLECDNLLARTIAMADLAKGPAGKDSNYQAMLSSQKAALDKEARALSYRFNIKCINSSPQLNQ